MTDCSPRNRSIRLLLAITYYYYPYDQWARLNINILLQQRLLFSSSGT